MKPRREYAITIAVLLAASIAIIVAYGATWITAVVPVFRGETTPTRVVSLTGSMLFGSGAAAGWVAAACTAGIVATRTWGRSVIGVIAALAGAIAGVPAVTFILSRGPLVSAALDGDEALEISGNAWWVVAVIAGLAVMVTGAIAALRGRRWPTMSARYDRTTTRSDASTPSERREAKSGDAELWDALDRGEDPT